MNKLIGFADYVGMAASALCLLHCLGMPLFLFMYPLFDNGQQEESLHQIIALIVTGPVLVALIPGFIAHRKWPVLTLGLIGLASFVLAVLMIGSRYGESAEILVAVAGGLMLLAAHVSNRCYCIRCAAAIHTNRNCANQCNSVAYRVK